MSPVCSEFNTTASLHQMPNSCECVWMYRCTHSKDAEFYISAACVTQSHLQETCVICTMNNTHNVMAECRGKLQVQISVWRPALWTDFLHVLPPPSLSLSSPRHNKCQNVPYFPVDNVHIIYTKKVKIH
jgi:hypothetical protein